MEITCGTSLIISYDCAARPPYAANANCLAFTKDEVEAIRSLIQPYVQKGILCGFGYRQGTNNILGAQYAVQDDPRDAFTVTKCPNGRFDVVANVIVPVPDFNITFAETAEFIGSFLSVHYMGHAPVLTPFNIL